MKKILKYDALKYDLTEDEAKIINDFLSSRNRPTHFTFRGQSLKAMKMEVFNEGSYEEVKPFWTKDHLLAWEKEIFPQFDTFNDYLISENICVVNERYPEGAVRDYQRYQEMTTKWNALNSIRKKYRGKIKTEVVGNIPEPIKEPEYTEEEEAKRKVILSDIPF